MEVNIPINANKKLEKILINIDEKNYLLIIRYLQKERKLIINYFKELKEKGLIKNISKPKCKKIQKELNELREIKRQQLLTINKIKLLFE